MDIQFWLAELDQYGNPKLIDGAHSNQDGAEQALTLIKRLGYVYGRSFAIAEVKLSKPTGKHKPINEEAIILLNSIKS